MHKYIGIAVKFLLAAYLAFFLTRYTLYKVAVFEQRIATVLKTEHPKEESEVLARLIDLNQLPILGSMFVQPLAEELIRLERYSEGLELVEDSLSSIFKRKEYGLWFSKAKAELFLERLEECE